MGAHADVADHAAVFKLHDVTQIVRVLHLLPLFFGVHIVNHAEVNIVRLQATQKVLKRGADIFHVARPEILLVLPCRADVSLNVPLSAVIFDTFADDVSRLRVRHPAV